MMSTLRRPTIMFKAELLLVASLLRLPRHARSFSAVPDKTESILSLLKNPSLLESRLTTTSSATFPVYNPAEPNWEIARVPIETDADDFVTRSSEALPKWRDGTTAMARSQLLTRWSAALADNADDLATIMTLESGKPLQESYGEVNYARSFLDYYAGEAIRPTGFNIPTPFVDTQQQPRGHLWATTQAVGVTGLITPWNFPLAMITRKVGPALAAGCTAIVKPSELTPLSALALQQLSPFPPHVLQTITTDTASTPAIGKALCTDPRVAKMSFTGSTRVGKQLMAWSSQTVQRLSLELGGNAPFIVFADADLEQASSAAMASKFRNAGQTCVCADRFLIAASVYDRFVELFCEKASRLQLGPGMIESSSSTTLGPLISQSAVDSVDQKVRAALKDGAKCVLGGSKCPEVGEQFYQATVLTDVPVESDIWKTETFGPVAAIRSFETEEEALEIANDSRTGLAAYICTKDLSRAMRVSQRIESGLVGVNEGVISTCLAPFGGIKESGLGREGSPVGIQEYLETKYTYML